MFKKESNVFKTVDNKQFVIQSLDINEESILDTDYDLLDDTEFNGKYNINKKDIITYGITNDISVKVLKQVIGFNIISKRIIPTSNIGTVSISTKHFECFTIPNWNKSYNPIHDDYKSSWNCLIQQYYNPKYIIIYNKYNKSVKFNEFKDKQ